MVKEFNQNLQMKLIDKLVKKKFEYWKEEFIKRIKDALNTDDGPDINETINKLAEEKLT